MRRIEEKMLSALDNGLNFNQSNTRVCTYPDGEIAIYLHDNKIASIYKRVLTIDSCGWDTLTTKSRLNAILWFFGLGSIFQKNFQWFIQTETETIPFNGSYFFNL